ncbi:hypothetical protein [Methylomonas methanica]|uniref:hypothetical protein n=1 Tax=Methylomonas methanica TaxID=421 RepID=UPI00059DE0F1|nr:hypothetical protein [Methylomonas methanica]
MENTDTGKVDYEACAVTETIINQLQTVHFQKHQCVRATKAISESNDAAKTLKQKLTFPGWVSDSYSK